MDILFEREALLRALATAKAVAEKRPTLPILTHVLIEAAAGGTVSFRATNLDLESLTTAEAIATRPGTAAVSVKALYELAKRAPKGTLVHLTDDDKPGAASVMAGPITGSLPTLPREDFPFMARTEYPARFSVPAPVLLRLLSKTGFAVSTEAVHYYLHGVYLHAATGKNGLTLRAVATDGYRLAWISSPLPDGAADMPGVIVPTQTVQVLAAALKGVTTSVEVSVSETKIRFTFGGTTLASKVIDGTFPDYTRVIPAGRDKRLDVDAAVLAGAVSQVAGGGPKKWTGVKLTLSSDGVALSCTIDGRTTSATVPAVYRGEDLAIGFNSRYLMDTLAQIEGRAALLFGGVGDPMLARAGDDDSAIYIIMPMQV